MLLVVFTAHTVNVLTKLLVGVFKYSCSKNTNLLTKFPFILYLSNVTMKMKPLRALRFILIIDIIIIYDYAIPRNSAVSAFLCTFDICTFKKIKFVCTGGHQQK